jgi:hypothetical protein
MAQNVSGLADEEGSNTRPRPEGFVQGFNDSFKIAGDLMRAVRDVGARYLVVHDDSQGDAFPESSKNRQDDRPSRR